MAKLTKDIMITKMIEKEPKLTRAAAERILKGVFEEIKVTVANGDEAVIPGFGAFGTIETKARAGHNPRTGEKLQIPAGKKIKFRASRTFKNMI